MRTVLLQSIMLICEEISSNTKLLINKGACIIKDIFLIDYPQNWNLFNSDMSQFLNGNGCDNQQIRNHKIYFYLKLFSEIHITIGDNTIDKSQTILKRDELLRDSLKSFVISDLISCILKIFEIFSSNTDLILTALDLLSGYCYWIDINLFFNQNMMDFIFKFIKIPHYTQVVFHCLGCMCEKGMPLNSKLALINYIFSRIFDSDIITKDTLDMKPFIQPFVAKFVNTVGLVISNKIKSDIKNDKIDKIDLKVTSSSQDLNYSIEIKQSIVCLDELLKIAIKLLQIEDENNDDSFIIIMANFILDYLVNYKKVNYINNIIIKYRLISYYGTWNY